VEVHNCQSAAACDTHQKRRDKTWELIEKAVSELQRTNNKITQVAVSETAGVSLSQVKRLWQTIRVSLLPVMVSNAPPPISILVESQIAEEDFEVALAGGERDQNLNIVATEEWWFMGDQIICECLETVAPALGCG
jgi:hypothetical protein